VDALLSLCMPLFFSLAQSKALIYLSCTRSCADCSCTSYVYLTWIAHSCTTRLVRRACILFFFFFWLTSCFFECCCSLQRCISSSDGFHSANIYLCPPVPRARWAGSTTRICGPFSLTTTSSVVWAPCFCQLAKGAETSSGFESDHT
jgi:hypothetical protein